MEKIKVESKVDDSLLEPLIKDGRIKHFLKKHQKDLHFLKTHASDFFMWQETLDKCRDCQGLFQCNQPLQGKVKTLDFDESGFLIQNFVSCKYQKAQELAHAHQKQFRLSHLSIQDLEIDLETLADAQSMEYLLSYKVMWESREQEKGVYLHGQPGVGKTYLCIGMANYYAKKMKSVSFVKMPQFISELKQAMYDNDFRQQQMNDLKYSDIVFLDDIGAEALSAWTRDEILLPILEYRMNHKKKTYFTSNYALEELLNQYIIRGEPNSKVSALRIIERIRSLAVICKLSGESRR